jgi:carbon monoxide dehydrogenase subunit G
MKVRVEVDVNAPKEAVWKVISNIEGSADTISAIQKLEVIDKPEGGLVGLKWRETRTMFGREATEVMWVTDAVENDHYDVRAESHGAVYSTTMGVEGSGEKTRLYMEFGAEVVTLGAKIMWLLTGWMMKGTMTKALRQDLGDIKAAVEGAS